MHFGIFDHVERRNDVGPAQQYEERLQFAATADAAGFYCYHVAEHHHSPLCLAPNQAVYLAVGSFHWGDLSHQEACRSLELFASEAMPAVP